MPQTGPIVDVMLEDLVGRQVPSRPASTARYIVLGIGPFGALVFERSEDFVLVVGSRIYRQMDPRPQPSADELRTERRLRD